MNHNHLKLFIRLAATHNISLAGQELSLSPAVAGNYISKLEANLGVRLFHRTTRKVSLTEEGQTFLPHAKAILATAEDARAAIGNGNSSPTGILRVTAPSSFGRMHIMPALKGFLDKYPGLSLDLRLSDTIVDLVEGGFDIAIRSSDLKDSTLIARKLSPDKRIVCASPEYLAQHGTPKSPKDLLDHQCINLVGLEQWQFQSSKGPLKIKTNGKLRTDSGEAMRDACINGLGVAVNSRWSVYKQLESGELVTVLDDYPLIAEAAIWAVYPSSQLLAPKVRVFIDYFAGYFGSPPYWE